MRFHFGNQFDSIASGRNHAVMVRSCANVVNHLLEKIYQEGIQIPDGFDACNQLIERVLSESTESDIASLGTMVDNIDEDGKIYYATARAVLHVADAYMFNERQSSCALNSLFSAMLSTASAYNHLQGTRFDDASSRRKVIEQLKLEIKKCYPVVSENLTTTNEQNSP